MKKNRRQFIQHGTASIGLSGLFAGLVQAQAQSAEVTRRWPAPKQLEDLLTELEATQTRFYNVPRQDGQFLNLLVKLTGAKRVLEIGTANGYSAIWFSLALEQTGGRMTTIEIQPRLVRAAKENGKRAGFEHCVEFLEGDAHELVSQVDGPFDLVFIDAELGGKLDYFNKLYPEKIPRGKILICHNAIFYRTAMEDYLGFIKSHMDFETVILSLTMKDGFALSRRKSTA